MISAFHRELKYSISVHGENHSKKTMQKFASITIITDIIILIREMITYNDASILFIVYIRIESFFISITYSALCISAVIATGFMIELCRYAKVSSRMSTIPFHIKEMISISLKSINNQPSLDIVHNFAHLTVYFSIAIVI